MPENFLLNLAMEDMLIENYAAILGIVHESRILLLILFSLLGGMLKYLDLAFEERNYGKKSYGIAATALAIWLLLSFYDKILAGILLAILIGAAFSGKLDNPAFIASAFVIFFSLFFINFDYLVAIFLTPFSIADELGNERFENFFFKHRFAMKIGMLLLFLIGYASFYYLSALILFDLCYEMTEILFKKILFKLST